MTELRRRVGVSGSDGHGGLARQAAERSAALEQRSRRPPVRAGRSAPEMEARVLAVRRAHPARGGRRIRRVPEREGVAAPSASTITQTLLRAILLDGAGAVEARGWVRCARPSPDELWQMGVKGHFALGQERCRPLTVPDDHSRHGIETGACDDGRTAAVRKPVGAVVRRHGLPRRIQADNGPPRGSTAGVAGPTPLSVRLPDPGIAASHGRPYHPQTQGKEEPVHRTLKAELPDGHRLRKPAEAQAAPSWRSSTSARTSPAPSAICTNNRP